MKAQRKTLDAVAVQWANTQHDQRVRAALHRANEYREDPERVKRIKAQQCIVCFYGSHVAGQSFTSRECADCETEIQSSNTIVAILCDSCAAKRKCCKMCGAQTRMQRPVERP